MKLRYQNEWQGSEDGNDWMQVLNPGIIEESDDFPYDIYKIINGIAAPSEYEWPGDWEYGFLVDDQIITKRTSIVDLKKFRPNLLTQPGYNLTLRTKTKIRNWVAVVVDRLEDHAKTVKGAIPRMDIQNGAETLKDLESENSALRAALNDLIPVAWEGAYSRLFDDGDVDTAEKYKAIIEHAKEAMQV